MAALLAASSPVMAEPDTATERDTARAYLDDRSPFLEKGAEPPGRSVPNPDGKGHRWEGATGWRTRHGDAVVRWSLGNPRDVTGARMPDGKRGDIEHVLDHGFRRRGTGARRWIYGTIDIRPNEVAFTDAPMQPAYTPPPPGDEPNLERTLAGDPAFLAALRDDRFAQATYIVLKDHEFVRLSDLGTWSCGDRQAARIVADLRGVGESYQDYFLRDDFPESWPDDRPRREAQLRQLSQALELAAAAEMPFDVPLGARFDGKTIETPEQAERAKQQMREVFERSKPVGDARLAALKAQLAEVQKPTDATVMMALHGHLDRLGWRTVNPDDERRMGTEAMKAGLVLLEDIKQLEALPPAAPGPWWKENPPPKFGMGAVATRRLAGLTPDERAVWLGLDARIAALAASGRVSQSQYDALRARDQAIRIRVGGYAKP